MSQDNPFATPNAPVNDVFDEEGFSDISLFSASGRLGRLRYFYYSILFTVVGMLLIGAASTLLSISPVLGGVVMAAAYIFMIVMTFLLTIQRCHDFDKTGWMSLLIIIPFVQLVYFFIPGTQGSNQYGKQTPPNTKAIVAGSILLPIILIVGMGMVSAVLTPKLMTEMETMK